MTLGVTINRDIPTEITETASGPSWADQRTAHWPGGGACGYSYDASYGGSAQATFEYEVHIRDSRTPAVNTTLTIRMDSSGINMAAVMDGAFTAVEQWAASLFLALAHRERSGS